MLEATKVDAAAHRRDGRRHRVDEWVQAVADATALPVDCVAVPEGGALGSAWLARIAAGLEEPMAMTEGRRWARAGRRVEPDPRWAPSVAARYDEFLELTGLGRPYVGSRGVDRGDRAEGALDFPRHGQAESSR